MGDKQKSKPKEEGEVYMSTRTQYLLQVMLFVYVGAGITFGGWISSYAVMAGVATKEEATLYSSIFWSLLTVSRFVFACLPFNSSLKLHFLVRACLAFGFGSLVLMWLDWRTAACLFSSVGYGVGLSSVFPLAISMPA